MISQDGRQDRMELPREPESITEAERECDWNGGSQLPDEVVRGKSLEEIREVWANKLGISPEQVMLEVLEKPGIFSRQWKVKVSWDSGPGDPLSEEEQGADVDTIAAMEALGLESAADSKNLQRLTSIWEDGHYVVTCPSGLEEVIPDPQKGSVVFNADEQLMAFAVAEGDTFELYPRSEPGELTWHQEVRHQGLTVIANVKKTKAGRFVLPDGFEVGKKLDLSQVLRWEEMPVSGECWDRDRLDKNLAEQQIVHGLRTAAWEEIINAKDGDEVILAEATLPKPGVASRVEEFIETEAVTEEEKGRVDFFASKIQLIQEGDVVARKIPGSQGTPGMDVFGRAIPVQPIKDFQFKAKKNVHLSEDGLEIRAACPGRPVRYEDYSYGVDNVYVLNQDVDLATGSIEFPGDVLINGNVQDGLRIIAGGKVEIRGGVSHAEVRGEKGVTVYRPVQGGKIVVGEKHVVRAGLLSRLKELKEELNHCLRQTAELAASATASNLKPGQVLKAIIERKFSDLPKRAADAEGFVTSHQDELITEELVASVRVAKRFLGGLGPLDPQAIPFLVQVQKALEKLVDNIAIEVPEKLLCELDYIQGTTVECGGNFICSKGAYNAMVHVDGNVEIRGVCRGGKISAGGNVSIRELGGSEVSSTFVQVDGAKKLKVDYCHPNVVIAVNKEIIRVEEACKSLVIYRERGKVEIEKLRVNPL